MFQSKGVSKLSLTVAAAALFAVAGCSNQATDQATNQAPAPAKKAAATKPAPAAAKPAAKPAPAKAVTAKPAVKKADTGKVVAAKGTTAKPAAASSKMTPATLVTVPKGTTISAKVSDALASNKNHAGDTFAAVLSTSIKVDGKTVIPKGTHVIGRVVTAKKRNPELTVALASVDLNGKSYKLVTEPIDASGKSQAKSTASESDSAKAADAKDITVAADHRLKFKLAKDVKLPLAAKG
jgi:hypothetical protein